MNAFMSLHIELLPNLFSPKSRSKDELVFSQLGIYQLIKGNTLQDEWESFSKLINAELKNQNHSKIIHNLTKMILLKKSEFPKDYTEYRPISIIAAWLITCEKLS